MSTATVDLGMATTTDVAPSSLPPTSGAWHRRRWTTAEFDTLMKDGYLAEGSKTFLWDGEIVDPMPENEPHANAQDSLQRELIRRLPEEDWTIRPAHPLALKEGYKPQPDLVVLVAPRANRRGAPTPEDTALIIEVADNSYVDDFGRKLPAYAAAGIPVYWIVNLLARRIEVYSRPEVDSGVGRYAERAEFPLETNVPLILARGGERRDFGTISVTAILKDSLEDGV